MSEAGQARNSEALLNILFFHVHLIRSTLSQLAAARQERVEFRNPGDATMAPGPEAIRESLKFGEDFELDLRAYELRRAGRALKLEPTPMELLAFLIERRGELVSRDQIVEKLWGQGVFLDTDNSINGAIRKIRQVLGDNPEQPRFVQTITGKGYRFIATVIEPETKERQQEQDEHPRRAAGTADAKNPKGPGRRWTMVLAGGL